MGDDEMEKPEDSQDAKNEDDLVSGSVDTEALDDEMEKPEDSQDTKNEDDLISTTENVDNDIQNANSDENVISDNQNTTEESNDEVKVGIFITEDIEDLEEKEQSLPEAHSGTEVDPPVSTSDKEASKEAPVPDTDEEVSSQAKDPQNENSIQI